MIGLQLITLDNNLCHVCGEYVLHLEIMQMANEIVEASFIGIFSKSDFSKGFLSELKDAGEKEKNGLNLCQ